MQETIFFQPFPTHDGGHMTLDHAKMEIRVLLIEDDAVDRHWVRKQLEAYPEVLFHLTVDTQLGPALGHLDSVFFDAVLLDLTLPDSHGGETILRTLLHSKGIPLIVLSGNRDRQLSNSARARGVYAYLIKGLISMSQLARTLHSAVLERRNFQAEENYEGSLPE
jgi:DNA-binding NarL/FixJ family response regulator